MKSFIFKVGFFLVLFFLLDAGIYYVLKKGMIKYYGLDKDVQILCVGHSHMVLGIDAERVERELGKLTAKYAIAGANIKDRLWMIKHALSLKPTVNLVIYEVDARMFDTEGLSSASYSLFLPFVDSAVMSQYLYDEATWQEFYTAKLIKTDRFRDQTLNIALRGLLNRSENKKTSMIRVEQYKGYLEREWQRKIRISPEAVACLRDTLNMLTARSIKVVLIYIPVIDLLNDPEREQHDQVIRIIEEMVKDKEQACFVNYNADYEARHDLFFDPRHLNEKGKQVVTSRLIEDLEENMLVTVRKE